LTVAGTDPMFVREEDTVVPSPTTAKRPDPPNPNADLYLQETLTRWDGWSLAIPRIGAPFQDTGPTSPDSGSSGFNLTTDWHVPGSSTSGDPEQKTLNALRLPRLRFGRTYQLRARATDLAGNAPTVKTAPHNDLVETAPLRHLRFEPLAAPRAVLLASGLWTKPPAPMPDVPVLRPGTRRRSLSSAARARRSMPRARSTTA
jgi:hypothetical protein